MVRSRVDGIDTNNIGIKLLHIRDVSSAAGGIGQRICVIDIGAGAVGVVVLLISDTLEKAVGGSAIPLLRGYMARAEQKKNMCDYLQLSAIVTIEEILAIDLNRRDGSIALGLDARKGNGGDRCQDLAKGGDPHFWLETIEYGKAKDWNGKFFF